MNMFADKRPCGNPHCSRSVHDRSPSPDYCSSICQYTAMATGFDQKPLRAEGMPAPSLGPLPAQTAGKTTTAAGKAAVVEAWSWLDVRAPRDT